MEERGYELSYLSSYLRERNWIQICLMGEHGREELAALPRLLSDAAFFGGRRRESAVSGAPATA